MGLMMTGDGTYAHGSRSAIVDTDGEDDDDGYEEIRDVVVEGGAVPLQDCDIHIDIFTDMRSIVGVKVCATAHPDGR
jgi:hypothetical protein